MPRRWTSQVSWKWLTNGVRFGVGGKADDVRQNTGIDVWLAVRKLQLSDDCSADIAHVLFCTRVIVGESAGMDSEKSVITYRWKPGCDVMPWRDSRSVTTMIHLLRSDAHTCSEVGQRCMYFCRRSGRDVANIRFFFFALVCESYYFVSTIFWLSRCSRYVQFPLFFPCRHYCD